MRLRIVAGRRVAFQAMAQIATRDKCHGPAYGINGLLDASAKANVLFIGQEAVAERDDAPLPAIMLQKIERHGGAVIQIETADTYYFEFLIGSRVRDLV